MAHSAELQRFIGDGDVRQLYALDRRSGSIVFMDVGQAETLRPDSRAGHLICPIEGCQSRAFTTSGGTVKRHHFRHMEGRATVHAAESYYHQLGKRLIGQHLQQRYPEARVGVDSEAVDNGQRPDVLVEFPDGGRFAFELQYSPLTVAAWTARHEGYRRQDVHDVWIFGHLPPHLRLPRHHRNARFAWRVELTELAKALDAAGLPIRFFSPDERQIATATVESERFFFRAGAVCVAYDDLAACEIRSDGFWTPTDEHEAAAREQRLDKERQARAELEAQQHIAEQRAAARLRRIKTEVEWKAWLKTQRPLQRAKWEAAAPRFLQLVALDELPQVITRILPSDWGTELHPAHWHARLFYEFIEGKMGETFTCPQAIRRLFGAQPHGKKEAKIALRGYLFELRRLGFLRFDANGYLIDDEILVVADLHHPPDPGLARELLRGLVLTSGNALVFATAEGRVLRQLRALRIGDHFEPLQAVAHRERERQERLAAWESASDPDARMEGRDLRVDLSPGEIVVYMYDDLWRRLRNEFREIAARHPGHARMTVTVFARGGPAIRDISMPTQVAATDDLAQALDALAPQPGQRGVVTPTHAFHPRAA